MKSAVVKTRLGLPRPAALSRWMGASVALLLTACGGLPLERPDKVEPANVNADAKLTPATRITRDLFKLPPPKFKVPVAVYAFRDQTGQFKPQPDSNLSNAVTQGAASILVKSLLDSGWYLPTEREGFQNLLNERRVARAIEVPADNGKAGSSYPVLIPAQFILEGGIVGYESNVRTGGFGANLLGIGGETKYRVDQVTVNLRSVDVRTGQVANSVSVTKTIFSHEVSSSVYQYVTYKTLLQAEGGYSSNEPSQLAVKEAIETAVIHLTLQGISNRVWSLRNDQDWYSPIVQSYMRDAELQLKDPEVEIAVNAPREPASMREPVLVKAAQLPLHMLGSLFPAETPAQRVSTQAPASVPAPTLVLAAMAPAPAPAPVLAQPAPIAPPAPPPAAPVVTLAPAKPVPVQTPVVPAPVQAARPVLVSTPAPLPTPATPSAQQMAAASSPQPGQAQASRAGQDWLALPQRSVPPAHKAPASSTLPEAALTDDILPIISDANRVVCNDCG